MRQSAGILLYKLNGQKLELLIVHPGGPFWAKKDKGAWSIPKGEFEDEQPLLAAKREFSEELGLPFPAGEVIDLGQTKLKSGKIIYCFAVSGDISMKDVKSNTFLMEWPPRSGQQIEVPEVDKVKWCSPAEAKLKLNPAQATFIDRLSEHLGVFVPAQSSLF